MNPDIYLPHIINLSIRYSGLIIEYIGLLIIVISVVTALVKLVSIKYTMEDIRSKLAQKIIFGLEFVIAADIILAAVTVDINELIQLGGVVLIRVMLGYTLRKEVFKK